MSFEISEIAEKKIEELKTKYPDSRSAVMMAIYVIQKEKGFLSKEAITWLANKIDMAPVQIEELLTFYTMFYDKPKGKYHFQVCRTLSCALLGAKKVTEELCHKFGIQPGEVSSDGRWSIEEVECLGSCGTAPVCQINDRFFENLTAEKLHQIIADINSEEPELKLSALDEKLADDFKKYPKSEI